MDTRNARNARREQLLLDFGAKWLDCQPAIGATGRTHQKFTAPDGDHQEVVTVKSRQAVNDEDIGAIHG